MRVWALASCGGMFMLTTYIAFRHDANAQKANEDILLGRSETNQDNRSISEVNHLEVVSWPELQGQLTSFTNTSANSQSKTDSLSSLQVQAQQLIAPVSPQKQSVFSEQWAPSTNLSVLGSGSESQSTQSDSLQSLENNLPVPIASQNRTDTSTDTGLVSGHLVEVELANLEANGIPVIELEESALDSHTSAIAAQPTAVNLSSDVVQQAATANATAPHVSLPPQIPQFSSNRASVSDQSTADQTSLTQNPVVRSSALKPTLKPSFHPQLP